jgi:type I restriction enzyme S subunit
MNSTTTHTSWTTRRLGDRDVALLTMGQSPASSSYNNSGIGLPFYQGKADFGLRHPVPRVWCTAPARFADKGDVLLSVRAPVGDVNVATERCCIGRGVASVRASQSTVGEYLFFVLMAYKDELDRLGSGAIFRAINKDTLVNFEIPVPPIAEQRAIAFFLSRIQDAIEIERRRVASLKELKAATMAKVFREGLRGEPLRQTEVGEIPQSWTLAKAETLCETISVGIVVTPAKYYAPSGIPCFRSFNVREDRLEDQDLVFISESANALHKKSIVRANDVLVVRTGYPGTACVVPERYTGSNCIDLIFCRPKPALIGSDYLARFLNSPWGKGHVRSSKGGLAQQHFNVGAMKRMTVALPTLAEQRDVSVLGQKLDARVLIAERKRDLLTALFASASSAVLSGRLSVAPLLERHLNAYA